MKSVLAAIIMLAALLYVIWSREARAEEFSAPAWAKAYHTCGKFGATDRDCDPPAASILTPTIEQLLDWEGSGHFPRRSFPPRRGDLYAFCDSTLATQCNERDLMLKDVCAETIRELTDGSARFSCAPVNAATRDAYLATLEPDKLANTFRAWGEGR